MKHPILFWSLLALLTSGLNYHISDLAQQQQAKLQRLSETITAEQEKSLVLQAEWAYVAAPARLQQLSQQRLNLSKTKPQQLVALNNLEQKSPAVTTPALVQAASVWQSPAANAPQMAMVNFSPVAPRAE